MQPIGKLLRDHKVEVGAGVAGVVVIVALFRRSKTQATPAGAPGTPAGTYAGTAVMPALYPGQSMDQASNDANLSALASQISSLEAQIGSPGSANSVGSQPASSTTGPPANLNPAVGLGAHNGAIGSQQYDGYDYNIYPVAGGEDIATLSKDLGLAVQTVDYYNPALSGQTAIPGTGVKFISIPNLPGEPVEPAGQYGGL